MVNIFDMFYTPTAEEKQQARRAAAVKAAKLTESRRSERGACKHCGNVQSVYILYEVCGGLGGLMGDTDLQAVCEVCGQRSHWKTYGRGALSTEDEAKARAFKELKG